MRRLGFLIPCLAILLTACNEEVMTGPSELGSQKTGKVTFALSADMRNDVVQVKSSSEDISVDEFWVEIFNASQTRIFCEKYADAKDTTLYINSGDYKVLATYGTETGVGFDKPFYKAEKEFTVGPQEVTDLNLTATLANVKVAVKFDENLGNKLSYDEYWAVVRNNGKKLRFNPNETRAGYIPAGELEFVLVVKINGEYKQYVHPAAAYAPNDFVTFDVKAGLLDGSIAIKVLVDNTVEVVEVEAVEVPLESILPIGEPAIFSSGFDGENTITYTEGKAEPLDEVWISAVAEGVISSATLSLDCAALGLPATVDLVNADASVAASFEAKGIWWKFNDDKTSLSIDLTDAYNDHISKIGYAGYDHDAQKCLPVAQISLSIGTASGYVTSAEDAFTVIAEPDAKAVLSWNEYDVWPARIVNPVGTVTIGDPGLFTLQGSADGTDWVTVGTPYVSGADVSFGEISGLNPGTRYYMRALYDGWYVASQTYDFTTESPLQVGNAGFEEWTDDTWTYDQPSWGRGESPMKWYHPWGTEADKWWDTNATASMRTDLTIGYTYFKSFPLVHYSTDARSGSRSAQLTVANVGNSNSLVATTGDWYVGELFSEGRSLPSRPAALTFWYEYDTYNDTDKFSAEIIMKAQDGTVLATGYATFGEASGWTQATVMLPYDVTDMKAETVHVRFKASTATSYSCSKGGTYLEIAGVRNESDPYRIKLNATLRIDDVELVY